jgi:DNA-binding transcriptional regulator YdaS (Cro superfamily)
MNERKPIDALRKFVLDMPEPMRNEFAARCGTTFAYLQQIYMGHNKVGMKMALAIERESFRAVKFEDLRPDLAEVVVPAKKQARAHAAAA